MQKILMIIAAGFLCLNSYAQDKKESYFGKK